MRIASELALCRNFAMIHGRKYPIMKNIRIIVLLFRRFDAGVPQHHQALEKPLGLRIVFLKCPSHALAGDDDGQLVRKVGAKPL